MSEIENSVLTNLKEQLDILKTEYIKSLNDKDVLINWGKPQLEALYNTRIGVHKIQVLQLTLQVKAMKRKLELVRSAIAKNEKIDLTDIELIIAAELARAEEKIVEEAKKITDSKILLSNLDSPQRSAELRTVFRSIAKNLHPDVNPGLNPGQTKIWNMFLEAYKRNDLDKLKALSLVYEKEIKGSQHELSPEQLTIAIQSLKEGCLLLQNDIDAIQSTFPFTIEEDIVNEDWINSETEKINLDIAQLKAYEEELRNEYKTLINQHD